MTKLKNLFLTYLFFISWSAYSQEKVHFISHNNFIFCVNTIEDGIFVISSINILDKKTSDALQTIEIEENMLFDYENAIKYAFILEDENFDGWADIRIVKLVDNFLPCQDKKIIC